VRSAGVLPDETVLEVGTGLGILSCALAARARRVITLEVDAGLVRALRAEALLPPNVELVHADALAVDWASLVAGAGGAVRIVANLPYSVATPLLRRFLDVAPRLRGWAVMVQQEMAQRLTAEPGGPGYSSLCVIHAWCAEVRGSFPVHPRCFHPVPRVRSTFLWLVPRVPSPLASPRELERLEATVRAGFAHRRKTLANSLAHAASFDPEQVSRTLARLGLDPRVRAEDLPPRVWLKLARQLPISREESMS